MSPPPFAKPRLPSHYVVRFEPPDASGDEVLVFRSERRILKLKGHSFRELAQRVLPLLDGRRTLEEIERAVADVFDPADLRAGLELLKNAGLLAEGDVGSLEPEAAAAMIPQLNYLHESGLDPSEVQRRLAGSTVAVFGAGSLGAVAARALASSGVGSLRLLDDQRVAAADPYLTAGIVPGDAVGRPRADALAGILAASHPGIRVETTAGPFEDDPAVARAIDGSDFVVSALDPARVSLIYRLNRVCWRSGTCWTSGAVSGFEGIVGPTVRPGESPCYLCYEMRRLACTEHPETEFGHLKFLHRRDLDRGGEREALVFGVGAVGHLLALEAYRVLASLPSTASGRIVVLDFETLTSTRHKVLRKPWCPVCYDAPGGTAGDLEAGP